MFGFYNIIGLLGVFLALLAYALLQLKLLKANAVSYSLLNLIGVLFILFSLFFDWNLSAAIIQVSWVFISLYGLIRAIKEKRELNQQLRRL